jgi:hypothetical protein
MYIGLICTNGLDVFIYETQCDRNLPWVYTVGRAARAATVTTTASEGVAHLTAAVGGEAGDADTTVPH